MSAFGGSWLPYSDRPPGTLTGITRLILAVAAGVKTSTGDKCTHLGGQKSNGSITTRKKVEHKKCVFYNVNNIIILFFFSVTVRLRILVNRFLRYKL